MRISVSTTAGQSLAGSSASEKATPYGPGERRFPQIKKRRLDPRDRELRSALCRLQQAPKAAPEVRGHLGSQLPGGLDRRSFLAKRPQQEIVVEQDPFANPTHGTL